MDTVPGEVTRLRNPSNVDHSPRYEDHPDRGCRASPTCLSCPLEVCIHDDPGALYRQETQARHAAIWAQLHQESSVRRVARMFQVSERMVHRVKATGIALKSPDVV